jgi:nitrogen fixation protein NifU and related proteins
MYNPTIMEHFQNPRNAGDISDADGIGQAGNAEKGDVMKMFIKVTDGIITDAKHQTFGSAVAIAVSSMASLMITGKTLDQAYAITREAVSDALDGIPPDKMTCSNMAPDAIRAAIDDYRKKHA